MRLYNKKQLEAVKFASPDPTRPVMNGVLFDGNSTIATDGHRLIVVTDTKPLSDDAWQLNGIEWNQEDRPFVIDREVVEKTIKAMPKILKRNINKENQSTAIGETDQGIAIQTSDNSKIETKNLDGVYPDYKQVLPDTDSHIKIKVNAKYLQDACAVLGKYNEKSHSIVLYINPKQMVGESRSNNYPLVITTDDGEGMEAKVVIMPLIM